MNSPGRTKRLFFVRYWGGGIFLFFYHPCLVSLLKNTHPCERGGDSVFFGKDSRIRSPPVTGRPKPTGIQTPGANGTGGAWVEKEFLFEA